jgi:SAM-dependent methyltransferase
MLRSGASHATSHDFTKTNVEPTRRFAREFGLSGVEAHQGSFEHIPFRDREFDFTRSNGVVMHTARPNSCLSQFSRVLRHNGYFCLYACGAGWVYRTLISYLHAFMKEVPIHSCISAPCLMGHEARYVAEFADDWYVCCLRTYTHHDLSHRLEALGFREPDPPTSRMDYDTSHRLNTFQSDAERALGGEGGLQYIPTNSQPPPVQIQC